MKLLSIDYGAKRIGLALGDTEANLVWPYDVIENKGRRYVLGKIKEIIKKESVEKIVVGAPYTLQGQETAFMSQIKNLANLLESTLSAPVVLEDERMSSLAADRLRANVLLKDSRPDKRQKQRSGKKEQGPSLPK
ncbi:MAG: Holliday junction resolvase RuvX [Candidatus Doudnabacteria bacterium]|nr:Holliday junction resolvase RuvX [Candidatus Doudnabacteria bacterium]